MVLFANPLNTTLQNGLASYYSMNGNANNDLGNNYNGVVHNTSFENDRFNNTDGSYSFTNNNDSIGLTNSSSINFNEFTISCWVKRASTSTNFSLGTIVNNYKFSTIEEGFWFGFRDNQYAGKLGMWLCNNAGVGTYAEEIISSSMPLNDGQWHHVVAFYDRNVGGQDSSGIYIDGELKVLSYLNYEPYQGHITVGNNQYSENLDCLLYTSPSPRDRG